MTSEQYGALRRIVREVKEKRAFKCIWIDCVCNHMIGGNDIDLLEALLEEQGTIEQGKSLAKELIEQGAKELIELISYEAHAVQEMKNGNAEIPKGWSIEKQRAFVQGMKHAHNILTK
jgi:hypothetical protein